MGSDTQKLTIALHNGVRNRSRLIRKWYIGEPKTVQAKYSAIYEYIQEEEARTLDLS
jgi:hypothetical protein